MQHLLFDRLQDLESRLCDETFWQKPVFSFRNYVFDYNVENEPLVNQKIEELVQRMTTHKVIEINLFSLIVELFSEHQEQLLAIEAENKYDIVEIITSTLAGDKPLEIISQRIVGADVIFLTGVATAYPFLKSSNILKRLAATGCQIPVILFYPGIFSGKRLHLFGTEVAYEDEYQIIKIA